MRAPHGTEAEPQPAVLPNYHPDPEVPAHRRRRRRLLIALGFASLLYGAAYALVGASIVAVLAAPLAVLGLLVLWSLPDSIPAPTRSMRFFFWAFVCSLVLWPNYLAITLPGLPWITLLRLTCFPMTALLMISTSVSKDFRKELWQSIDSVPLITRLLVIFVFIQTYSLALSADKGSSIQRYIVYQISWTVVFFAAAYVFRRPGAVERFAFTLWMMAIVVGALGVWEARLGQVPWAGHIPSLLRVEDEAVLRVLAGTYRAATGVHRITSTYTTPLALAEYIALTFPFLLHFATPRYPWATRAAVIVTVPFLIYVERLTDSRLGMVGCLLSVLVFMLTSSVRVWRTRKDSIFGPAIALAYPAIFCAAGVAVVSVGRLRTMVLGNGATQASTDSRKEQYAAGIADILHRPIGYGPGMAAETLDFHNPNGVLTIDTYFLAIGLEYGIIGFLVYYGMFGYAIYEAGRRVMFNQVEDRDQAFLAPIAISLVNFFVIKSVFSQQDNHPLVFAMLGALLALASRAPQFRPSARPDIRRRQQRRAAGSVG